MELLLFFNINLNVSKTSVVKPNFFHFLNRRSVVVMRRHLLAPVHVQSCARNEQKDTGEMNRLRRIVLIKSMEITRLRNRTGFWEVRDVEKFKKEQTKLTYYRSKIKYVQESSSFVPFVKPHPSLLKASLT